ncbi:hypothetical protein PCASD_03996 [Puccinia coronata f. sp. avenae]|uniref:Uncharacterized protein n=1 Tax=Puccinia coronata f. sp. avenae TaxID=200324 RepID=A0A2N5V5J5_9BASI|nr:hypothetical protein PCASD_03996 [Puccinia coronata f. sp. avenae]
MESVKHCDTVTVDGSEYSAVIKIEDRGCSQDVALAAANSIEEAAMAMVPGYPRPVICIGPNPQRGTVGYHGTGPLLKGGDRSRDILTDHPRPEAQHVPRPVLLKPACSTDTSAPPKSPQATLGLPPGRPKRVNPWGVGNRPQGQGWTRGPPAALPPLGPLTQELRLRPLPAPLYPPLLASPSDRALAQSSDSSPLLLEPMRLGTPRLLMPPDNKGQNVPSSNGVPKAPGDCMEQLNNDVAWF